MLIEDSNKQSITLTLMNVFKCNRVDDKKTI